MPDPVRSLLIPFVAATILTLVGCGGGGGGSSLTNGGVDAGGPAVEVSGSVTYERYSASTTGLDYDNPAWLPVRGATMIARRVEDGYVVDSAVIAEDGGFVMEIPSGIEIDLVVRAALGTYQDERVRVRRTSGGALWTAATAVELEVDSVVTIKLTGGWDETAGAYDSATRLSGAFAILDSIYSCEQLVLSADPGIAFPDLQVFWQPGTTVGSYYTSDSLYIVGDDGVDTDEFDQAVVMHEWGHFYEDNFSRSDSLGGHHRLVSILDDTVAFGEGFATALSAMVINHGDPSITNPLYVDTYYSSGDGSPSGFAVDVESTTVHAGSEGYWNEISIAKILYDCYDTQADGDDALALGFSPIHEVLTGSQRTSPAFTSLYSFLHFLKDQPGVDASNVNITALMEGVTTSGNEFGDDVPAIERHVISFAFDATPETIVTDPTGATLQTFDTFLDPDPDFQKWPGNKWLQSWYFRGTASYSGSFDLTIRGVGVGAPTLTIRWPAVAATESSFGWSAPGTWYVQSAPGETTFPVTLIAGQELVFAISSTEEPTVFEIDIAPTTTPTKVSN